MKKEQSQPIIVDADETFEQKVARYEREADARTKRIEAEVELKTRLREDKHNENWQDLISRVQKRGA